MDGMASDNDLRGDREAAGQDAGGWIRRGCQRGPPSRRSRRERRVKRCVL